MQGQNAFNQFQTAGPMGFGAPNQRMSNDPSNQQQFNPQFQQMQNAQMRQFQTMQPGMNFGMAPNQMAGPNPNVNMQQVQQNLTPPPKQRLIVKLENNERGFYSTMMLQLDPTDRGRVDSKEAVPFFKRSGLGVDVLKKIWIMTSSDNKTLDKEEFYAALRLVAYAQNNIEVSPNSILQNIKVPLPKLQTPVKPAEPKVETPVNNPNAGLDAGLNQPQPQPQVSNQFGGFPEPQPQGMGGMGGFGNFGAPSTNPSFPGGNMGIANPPVTNFNAMPDLMSGGGSSMPQDDLLGGGFSNPAPIQTNFANLSIQQPQPSATTSNFGGDLMSNTNISPSPSNLNNPPLNVVQPTSQQSIPSEEPQVFSSDVLIDMTPDYVKQYETLFEHFDTSKKGIVTQEEIGETFLRSGLNNEILFQIWSFCDTGDRGCLDKPEFMLALHLIAMSKKNIKLPGSLPVKYEKFLKEYKRKLPAKDFLIEKTRQNAEEQNMSPSRRTMEQDMHQNQPSDSGMYGGGHEATEHYDYGNQIQSVDDYSHNVQSHHAAHDSAIGNFGETAPVHQPSYGGDSTNYSGGGANDMLSKMQEHQNELVAASTHIRDTNNRALSDKSAEVQQLNAILQNCQNILQRLRNENDYIQSEMVKLDNQKKNIQKSIESVQHQINDELVRQQGLHQNLKLGGTAQMPVPNRASFGSPVRANDDQFNVDFQKEFAGGWDGFDNNFGDQNKNPNLTPNNNNFGGDFGF
jgi:hypothetical protein